jgi:uncharacterized protein (DUF924 family)
MSASAAASAADDEDPFVSLFSLWYGIAPAWSRFESVKGEKFWQLWTQLWFAKGALQAPLDARLAAKYAPVFELVKPYFAADGGLPQPPANLPPGSKEGKLWIVGVMLLCDQLSRNCFRGSARAYEADLLARRIAGTLLPEFDTLPVPIRASLILVLVHSERLEDWGLAPRADGSPSEDLIAHFVDRVKGPLSNNCPEACLSLQGISNNHRDRMRLFGRVPERNKYLGRESTDQELAYIAQMTL